jgi:hypothetical protein
MIYTSALSRIEKIIHEKYELSATIRHRGERGRQRENGLLLFLRENLPVAYGVATGEIFSFKGSLVSPQCDIIIYDQQRMPILGRSEAIQQVPLEAVYGVIECRSILNKAALKDAHDKFAKIRLLPRCPSKTKLKKGTSRGPTYILFGYQLKTSIQSCLNFMESEETDDITVLALNSGCGIWVNSRDHPLWLEGTAVEQNSYETLAIFYVTLLETLRSIDLGEPSFIKMLLVGG